jgi:iduronate 2-sulfatase
MAKFLGWFFACCCLTLVGATLEADEAARPNVLWIVVDDLNTDLGCYGQSIAKTPNIDRLAARGIRFERAYAQYALCNPSRSSFLSGYRPDKTGVIEQEPRVRDRLPDAVFLPQLFRKNGYFTAATGKIHHGGKHIDRDSWDSYDDNEGTDEQVLAARKERAGNPDRTPKWVSLSGDGTTTQDGTNTRTMLRLLDSQSRDGKPFFLALGLHKPHVPWTAPRRFFDLYPPSEMPRRDWLLGEKNPKIALQTEWPIGTRAASQQEGVAAYLACVSFTDSHVGMLMQALDRHDLWKNTVVVFMGDHGFHLGDRGLWSKKTLFEQSLRVPLIIVRPGEKHGGATCLRTVQLLDIYPTLAELCGVKAPGDLDGHSLQPLLVDPTTDWPYAAYSQVVHEGITGRSVRTQRWRYTQWENSEHTTELYDHDLDPWELQNLAERQELAATVKELASLLDASNAQSTGN